MILCRLYARLSRVRPCTLLSAFAQAPRLTRNCFPNGGRTRNPLSRLRAAAAQTADNSRMILCRLYARLSRVRPCTLLSAFTQAPRLTRNCFPNGGRTRNPLSQTGGERAIHCRAYGFSRSCTSLYTPVEKSAPSASCARLRRKRQAIPARYFIAFRRYHVRNGRGRRAMSASGMVCPINFTIEKESGQI